MYPITQAHIQLGHARSGLKNLGVKFLVAHDTANPGSTARNNRDYFNNRQPSASAHTFIDDKDILEIVPLDEKAWHVRYQIPLDNQIYGDDANDIAIGVELCYGGNINFQEAYKRYVWYFAYLCKKYDLDPTKQIIGHENLDPGRKFDPSHVLLPNKLSFDRFIQDVVNELKGFTPKPVIDTPKRPSSELVKKGDRGAKVSWVQTRIIAYYGNVLKVDGIFGDVTEKWVRKFQREHFLKEDGLVGVATTGVLSTDPPSIKRPYPNKLYKLTKPYMKDYNVKLIQKVIGANQDGVYGPNTAEKVKQFQKLHGLTSDGIVGKNTWSKMFN